MDRQQRLKIIPEAEAVTVAAYDLPEPTAECAHNTRLGPQQIRAAQADIHATFGL
jgi:hypothetical protein